MFCEDMWLEILSKLPVKSLIRFTCVSKYFQSLICDPRFAKQHLQKSPKSTNFLLSYSNQAQNSSFVFPSHISSCFEDSLPFFSADLIPGSKPHRHKYRVLGSCNGLVCLRKCSDNRSSMFHLWNPATQKLFENRHCMLNPPEKQHVVMLGFGYDNSRDTYKMVAIVGHLNSEDYYPFRSLICSMNDSSGWRDIQDFPADPSTMEGDGIYLNSTLNWLGLPDNEYDDIDISFDELVIASLDLETETYTQLLLPRDLNGVLVEDFFSLGQDLHSNEAPLIGVLSGCLSLFLHNRKTKHLSIWQMKEFGNQNSWTRLLNTSLQDLGINCTLHRNLLPLCMIENDRDIIIIHSSFHNLDLQAVVYNRRDKTVESRMICGNICWIFPLDYVESLVSPIR